MLLMYVDRMKKTRKAGAGRKPKGQGATATRHIGAGVSDLEWPQVEAITAARGGNRSTIIRAAFGLPPAIP